MAQLLLAALLATCIVSCSQRPNWGTRTGTAYMHFVKYPCPYCQAQLEYPNIAYSGRFDEKKGGLTLACEKCGKSYFIGAGEWYAALKQDEDAAEREGEAAPAANAPHVGRARRIQ